MMKFTNVVDTGCYEQGFFIFNEPTQHHPTTRQMSLGV